MHRAVICKASSADALITRPLGMRVAPKLEVFIITSDQACLVALGVKEVAIVGIAFLVVATEDYELTWAD